MRTYQEQWTDLNILCGYLELANLPHEDISTRQGEPDILHLPVSRRRNVVYVDGGYDIWKKSYKNHLIAADLSVEAVVHYLQRTKATH
jgi:hypothetical protein